MEEKKKSNKGLIMIIVVLVILLLGSIGCIGYGYIKYDNFSKKYDELNNKYEEQNKDLESSKNVIENTGNNYIASQDGYNIYADFGFVQVIGYEGNLYLIESFNNIGNLAKELVYYEDDIKFIDDVYTIEANGDDTNAYIVKLNIKEDDISKVMIFHYPAATDASYSIFLIYKTGEVKYLRNGEKPVNLSGFENYKVKDIEKFYCSSGAKLTCKGLQVDAILQDGTSVVIDNIK